MPLVLMPAIKILRIYYSQFWGKWTKEDHSLFRIISRVAQNPRKEIPGFAIGTNDRCAVLHRIDKFCIQKDGPLLVEKLSLAVF